MRSLLPFALLATSVLATAHAQTTRYVNGSATGANTGVDWANAFTSLQAGLAASAPGDTLWVATGFYTGTFNIPAGVTVMGRFVPGDPSELMREVNFQTILHGLGAQRVVTMGAGSVIDGLSIQGGQAGAPGGGGLLIDGVSCKVRNCTFTLNNDSAGAGAAILVRNGANPRIENCLIYLNGDASSGAAIEIDGASGTYINNTIDTNEWSGIRIKGNATPAIYNNILSNNGIVNGRTARGIEQLNTSVNPTVGYNLFFNNNTSLYLHGSTELMSTAAVDALGYAHNSKAGDPQFAIPQFDYRFPVSSPCVDAGSPTQFPERTQCFFDNCRRINGDFDTTFDIDIGAYEYCDVELRLSRDTHTHVHMHASSQLNLPIFTMLAFFPSSVPGGLLIPGFGYFFIDVGILFVFPLPPTSIFAYGGAGVPPGLLFYFQMLTVNNNTLVLSNPAVHVTNP